MLKAADETGTMWMTDVCNPVMMDGKIPEDWCRCLMETIYTVYGDFLTWARTGHRDIKVLEHLLT